MVHRYFSAAIAKVTVCKGLVTRDEQLTWSDLTPRSGEKLLQKRVVFL